MLAMGMSRGGIVEASADPFRKRIDAVCMKSVQRNVFRVNVPFCGRLLSATCPQNGHETSP